MILGTEAHERAARRLLKSRGSVYEAFDGLDCGLVHDEVVEFLEGAPSFMSLPEDHRGKVAGIVMGFALVAVESDRKVRP